MIEIGRRGWPVQSGPAKDEAAEGVSAIPKQDRRMGGAHQLQQKSRRPPVAGRGGQRAKGPTFSNSKFSRLSDFGRIREKLIRV